MLIGKIIIFRVYKTNNTKKLNDFCKKFYGQNTSSHKGRYRYRRKGFLDCIPHKKLIRGAIIVRLTDSERIISFLKEYDAEVYARDIILTDDDEKVLGIGI